MQLLQTHKAYPKAADPDLFSFTRGTLFSLELFDTPDYQITLVIQSAVSQRLIYVPFGQIVSEKEYPRQAKTLDQKKQWLADTLSISVYMTQISTFRGQMELWADVISKHIKRSVQICIGELKPADFYSCNKEVVMSVMSARITPIQVH